MVSKVLALLAQSQGFEVKQSEVHGMAKRGGSVFSHVRFGPQVWSPTIPKGEVDILVALEWAEGLRWLPFLKPGTGIFICDTKRIVPPFACLNRHPGAPLRYSRETPAEVDRACGGSLRHRRHPHGRGTRQRARGQRHPARRAVDGARLFRRGLGEDGRRIRAEEDRSRSIWRPSVAGAAGSRRRATPRRRWKRRCRRRRRRRTRPTSVRLEITPEWCKSCDICVKLCPERCLRLNADRIAELAEPDKCTGCRLCEWLCPDFAIRVHLDAAAVAQGGACPMNAVDTALTGKNAVKLISGNHACALGAIAAGCRFFAGYPITPSSEIAERLARLLPEVDGVFVQMEDEIASMAAVIGASMGGVKAMTATSGPGFSLKQENIGYAAGAEIPCVIVNVMRGGPSTGMPTRPSQADMMQARWGSHGDYPIIALTPASVREIYSETIRAFDLAEQCRTPVVLLYDQVIAQLSETVALDGAGHRSATRKWASGPRAAYKPYDTGSDAIPAMAKPGDGYRTHTTGLTHGENGFPTQNPEAVTRNLSRLFSKLERHRDLIDSWEALHCDDADVVIVAIGISARAATRAVELCRAQGLRVGLFRPITLWPFPETALRQAAAQGARRAGARNEHRPASA